MNSPEGVLQTHYQRWTETYIEPSPGPLISRPNPPSTSTMRSDDSIIEIEDLEPCSSSSFHSGAPGELPTLSISTESPSPRSLNRDLAPTIPYAIPSWSLPSFFTNWMTSLSWLVSDNLI